MHRIGEVEFHASNIVDDLGREIGDEFPEMGMENRMTKARELGLDSLWAEFFLNVEEGVSAVGKDMIFNRLG